jgi:hypothetical protein
MVQHEYIKRSDVVGRVLLLGACFDYMDVEIMAIVNGANITSILSSAIHSTVKEAIRQKFIELIVKDIEPILTEYTNQIVTHITEIKDPYSMDGLKINVTFKLPEMK